MGKCTICGNRPAPHRGKSLLTEEQKEEVNAYHASFNGGFHTGHLRPELMELPRLLCEKHKND